VCIYIFVDVTGERTLLKITLTKSSMNIHGTYSRIKVVNRCYNYIRDVKLLRNQGSLILMDMVLTETFIYRSHRRDTVCCAYKKLVMIGH